MTALSLLPGEAASRSRKVQYYAGDWPSIQSVLPEFELKPFSAGPDEPANPFQQIVMRKPLSAAERPIPVGIVSHAYSLPPTARLPRSVAKGWSGPALSRPICVTKLVCRNWANG